jgi:polyisoprenoid-binding protein YceI
VNGIKRFWKWIVTAVVVAVGVAVAAPFVYIHFIQADPPRELSFKDADAANTTASTAATVAGATTVDPPASAAAAFDGNVAGTWNIVPASQFGYRVNEVLFGQKAEAAGRTSEVAGSIQIDGLTVSKGELTVQLANVKSGESQRDGQFRGRIMNVSQFPTAKFTLTKPIALTGVPADKVEFTTAATGDLTVHGVTKSITVNLAVRRDGSQIQAVGKIPIVFADYNIDNPSGGPAQTEDHGVLELLAIFQKA